MLIELTSRPVTEQNQNVMLMSALSPLDEKYAYRYSWLTVTTQYLLFY